MARKVPVTEDLSIHINASTAAKLPRSVGTIHNFLFLLEVLLMGYVIVGNFTDRVTGTLFCSLQVVKDYLNYVRGKVAPLGGGVQSLSKTIHSDEDTRCLWAEGMRSGLTFDQAVKLAEPKVEAFWLWSCAEDARDSREIVQQDSDNASTPPPKRRRIDDGKSWMTEPPQKQADKPRRASGPSGGIFETTSTGKAICRLWNEGKCAKQCKNQRVHACNQDVGGRACGSTQHRRCEGTH